MNITTTATGQYGRRGRYLSLRWVYIVIRWASERRRWFQSDRFLLRRVRDWFDVRWYSESLEIICFAWAVLSSSIIYNCSLPWRDRIIGVWWYPIHLEDNLRIALSMKYYWSTFHEISFFLVFYFNLGALHYNVVFLTSIFTVSCSC